MGIQYIFSVSGIVLHFVNFGLGCGALLAYLVFLFVRKKRADIKSERTWAEINSRRPPVQGSGADTYSDNLLPADMEDWDSAEENSDNESLPPAGICKAVHMRNLSAIEKIGLLIDEQRAVMAAEKEEYEKNLARVQRLLQQHKEKRMADSDNISAPAPQHDKLRNMFDNIRAELKNTGGEARRGRGRPRKEPQVQAQGSTVKRGRGRPRKYPEGEPYPDSSNDAPKRGRGRPRKTAASDTETSAAREPAADTVIYRDISGMAPVI